MTAKATATSWKTKPMPAVHKELPLSGVYTAEEYEQISAGFLPQSQDDRWFIYLEEEWLYFHRSWTGTCVFKLQIVLGNCKYHATRAIVNRDPEQYRSANDQQDVQLISHLIDDLLLGRFSVLPLPDHLSPEDQQRYQKDMMGKSGLDGLRLNVKGNGRS